VGYIYSANAGLIAAVFRGRRHSAEIVFTNALLMNHSVFDISCFALCRAVSNDAVGDLDRTLYVHGVGNG
jgi:hypothetical protein